MQINCPACKGGLVVPGTAPAPIAVSAPVPTSGPASLRRQAPSQPSAPTAASGGCPSCGAGLGRGAVLCTNCGYNLATGQRTVAGRPAAMGKPTVQSGDTPWYKTIYPYLAAFFVLLAVLYFLGRSNTPIMLGMVALSVLYIFAVHIIVTVAAFKESVVTGLLTLCIGIYALYFVFKVSDNDTLKLLYGIACILGLCINYLVLPSLR